MSLQFNLLLSYFRQFWSVFCPKKWYPFGKNWRLFPFSRQAGLQHSCCLPLRRGRIYGQKNSHTQNRWNRLKTVSKRHGSTGSTCTKVSTQIVLIEFLLYILNKRSLPSCTNSHIYAVLCNWVQYLHVRNRNHLPCFYRVIQTWVEVWEDEKCCGNTSRRRVFPQLFRVLPNFHECLHNSIETQGTCFLFLLENTATTKRKATCKLWLSKCKLSLLAPSHVNSAC